MRKLELTGVRFGRLVAVRPASPPSYWLCRCDCGQEKSVFLGSLRRGLTTSCGCFQREVASRLGIGTRKHGLWTHRLYNLFMQIKYRCENPRSSNYENYGGRGIKCRFRGPVSFIRWGLDNGYRRGLSIDRIDNDGPYSPANCRWVAGKEQARNTRRNRILTINGVSRCAAEWAESAGIPYATVKTRLRKGWSHQRAVLTPVNELFSRART